MASMVRLSQRSAAEKFTATQNLGSNFRNCGISRATMARTCPGDELDQAAFFSLGDEVIGPHVGVAASPADQRFGADDASCLQLHDRLIQRHINYRL